MTNKKPEREPEVWLLDLDGVVWLAGDAIDGSADAVARLRDAGRRVLFLTNNSARRVDELVEMLRKEKVPAEPDDLVTSAQAAARMLEPGSRALVCAGPGVEEALERRGVTAVRECEADAVVVGFHFDFDFKRLTAASNAARDGARLIGTNDDATYPTPDGPIPGGGAILAAVATAAGVEAEVAGKPHEPMADEVRARLGDDADAALANSILVGDRPSTDGRMAARLEVPFVLVLSGVTSEDQVPEEDPPDKVAPDLGSLVGPSGELL